MHLAEARVAHVRASEGDELGAGLMEVKGSRVIHLRVRVVAQVKRVDTLVT